MMVVRFLSIVVFYKYLKKTGYGISMNEIFMMSYAHLKGSMVLAFTLYLAADERFSTQTRDIILFNLSSLACFT